MLSTQQRYFALCLIFVVTDLFSRQFTGSQLIVEIDNLKEWGVKKFAGETHYEIVQDERGRSVIKASSNGTASALYWMHDVDLNRFPYLSWRWKVDGPVHALQERTKEGDDFAARIYVIYRDGWFQWQTKAINFVWSFSSPKGEYWPNPFTDNAMMVSMTSANHTPNKWQTERIHVKDYFTRTFGLDIDKIDGLAIMTDSDNSAGRATAYYSDIMFLSD